MSVDSGPITFLVLPEWGTVLGYLEDKPLRIKE